MCEPTIGKGGLSSSASSFVSSLPLQTPLGHCATLRCHRCGARFGSRFVTGHSSFRFHRGLKHLELKGTTSQKAPSTKPTLGAHRYVCMHVCTYVCVDAWMHACMHAGRQAGRHAGMQACRHAGMQACMHAWMDGCMYVCMLCMSVCIYACTYVLCMLVYVCM